jgi:hypothetical protein
MRAVESVLRVEMYKALQDSAPAVIDRMRTNARERLPKAGGLNQRVAADAFVVQDRSSILQAAIRIGTAATDARGSNRGRIRHPVFGNRQVFVEQTYEPAKNWFYDAVTTCQPGVKAKVEVAMKAAAEKTLRAAAKKA